MNPVPKDLACSNATIFHSLPSIGLKMSQVCQLRGKPLPSLHPLLGLTLVGPGDLLTSSSNAATIKGYGVLSNLLQHAPSDLQSLTCE